MPDNETSTTISWAETRRRRRIDQRRLRELRSRLAPYRQSRERFTAANVAVALYRVSHYLYVANFPWTARFMWHLNVVLTGADISEPADIGPGFVVLHPPGVSIMGKAGRNFTVMAATGIGGEVNRSDNVAGWPGVPTIGDDVTLEPHSAIFGPVTIGDRVRVCSGAMVARDVDDDTIVSSPRVKHLRISTATPSKI